MAWDPPTAADVAAKGRHAARIFRALTDQSGQEWESRNPDGRLQLVEELVNEMTGFFGHPGMSVRLAKEPESWELAEQGRSVKVASGETYSAIYERAFDDAVGQVQRALESKGIDPEGFDLSRARGRLQQAEFLNRTLQGLPEFEGLVVDPAMLEGGFERLPILMETVVERVVERVADLDVATEAPSWGTEYAGGFARELGVDYSPVGAEAPAPVTIPPIVSARESPQVNDEIIHAYDALPADVDAGWQAMSSLGDLDDPRVLEEWDRLPTWERVKRFETGMTIIGKALESPWLYIEAADPDQLQLLRSTRRVAQIIPEEGSLGKHLEAFEASKECILETLEEQGLDRDWIDPREIRTTRSPRQTMVVDRENFARDIHEMPHVIQALMQGMADDMNDTPDTSRQRGVAAGYGAALQSGTTLWSPLDFGTGNAIDSSLEELLQDVDHARTTPDAAGSGSVDEQSPEAHPTSHGAGVDAPVETDHGVVPPATETEAEPDLGELDPHLDDGLEEGGFEM
jgi:hypothetical protein